MGVHYGKTHAFVVGTKHMTSDNECISVTINEHSIESVSAQKHLGITIDKKLTLEQHIDLVCRNVSRKLTLMKLLSKYVNQNSLKQYYYVPHRRGGGHIVFGADPVGVGVSVGVGVGVSVGVTLFCLHDIS